MQFSWSQIVRVNYFHRKQNVAIIHPTSSLLILEPQDPDIGEFYVYLESSCGHFEAP